MPRLPKHGAYIWGTYVEKFTDVFKQLKYGAYIPEQIKNSGHFIWSHEDGLNAISSPGKKDQTVRRITLTVLAFDLNGI